MAFTKISKKYVQIFLDGKFKFKDIDIYIGEDYLLSAKAGKTGMIKVHKGNKIGQLLVDAINMGEKVRVVA